MSQSPTSVRHRAPLLAAALALLALALIALPQPPKADSAQPTAAKKKTITGKLTKRGYTVIALAADGEAKTKLAPKGKFKLRPPANKVSLHLRASDGTYAGPITLRKAKKGKRAILGLKIRGAKKTVKLGKVEVKKAKGYAKLSKRAQKKLKKRRQLDSKRQATAKKGVPIGAGNFGRVRVKKLKKAPGDLDRDGVSDPLDIDDDGDLVLDNLDRNPRKGSKARAAQSETGDFPISPWLLGGSVNANAPGLSEAQIEAALPSSGQLGIGSPPEVSDDPTASSELDCGQPQGSADPGLIYCTRGGTGRVNFEQGGPGDPFPGERFGPFDPDGDGFGSWPPGQGSGLLRHGATSDQIKTGDVLIQRVERSDGSEEEYVATLPYVFETTPALVSYDDGQGNSQELSYPIPPGDKFPVEAGPSGDVVVELTFWRPQRRPIPPETGDWYDLGGLGYGAAMSPPPGVPGLPQICDQGTYSTDDPNLVPTQIEFIGFGSGGGFVDLAPDQPASPDNTFTFQLNLSECAEGAGGSFDPGETESLALGATTSSSSETLIDLTTFGIFFQRAP